MSRLPKSQVCPIHRSRYCCGRDQDHTPFKKNGVRKGPVMKVPDEHHPRGYIEVCTPAELRRRLIVKMRVQANRCGICGELIIDFRDAELDHIEPQPAGCKKDSHMDNLQATHRWCNREKGSQRNYELAGTDV